MAKCTPQATAKNAARPNMCRTGPARFVGDLVLDTWGCTHAWKMSTLRLRSRTRPCFRGTVDGSRANDLDPGLLSVVAETEIMLRTDLKRRSRSQTNAVQRRLTRFCLVFARVAVARAYVHAIRNHPGEMLDEYVLILRFNLAARLVRLHCHLLRCPSPCLSSSCLACTGFRVQYPSQIFK